MSIQNPNPSPSHRTASTGLPGASRAIVISALLAGGMFMAPQLSVSPQGVEAVKRYEGLMTRPYIDPVGILTVCYGDTKNVNPLRTYTEQECTARLQSSLGEHSDAVSRWTTVPLTQGQFDMLSSFVYNVGETQFRNSTLLKKLNALDCWGSASEFKRWIYAGGTKLRGLELRRADERQTFEEGCRAMDKILGRAPKE